MPTPVDVLCVGHAAYDLTFTVPHHPAPDEKTTATALASCGGGPAANAAVLVARLGFRAAFAGYLGVDVYSDLHLQELEREGVNTSLIARGTNPTPLSVALVKPTGARSLVNYRGRTTPLAPHSLDFTHLAPRVILFDGHEPGLSPPLAAYARARGIPTVLDAGSIHPGTLALASCVDYLVCSETFARDFTGEPDEWRTLARLSAHAPCVVITLGARGLIWQTAQGKGALPAYPITPVDTTGAGDAFHGAFAAALAAGYGWQKTLQYASAAAALCCTQLGARPGLPTQTQLTEFLVDTI